MADPVIDHIVSSLWSWVTSNKGNDIVKDTTRIANVKYDCYIDSSMREPLSFSVFELSDKGDIIINDVSKIVDSQAAFFIFVNTKSGWIVAVKNNLENQKKLIKGEPVQNLKVRIVP